MIVLMVVLLAFFMHGMVLVLWGVGALLVVWNSRTKLCCIVSEKWNVTRVSLREFDIGYISSVKTKWGETEGIIMLNVVIGSALRFVSCGNIKWFQIVAGGHRCFTIRCNRGCFEIGYHFHKSLKFWNSWLHWQKHCLKNVRVRICSGPHFSCIFSHSDWIPRDTECHFLRSEKQWSKITESIISTLLD